MTIRRTNKGASIDMEALMSQAPKHSPAVGNMRVNAKGDLLGPSGEVVKTNEQRVREFYQQHPSASTSTASLKGRKPTPDADAPDRGTPVPKTAKTQQENVRTQQAPPPPAPAPTPEPAPVAEPEEFDAPEQAEPVGYREVELPNGDIEMVPVYKDSEGDQ